MYRTFYIFANIGFINQLPKSGGQSSARRVVKGLKDIGYEVKTIRRHRAESEGIITHRLEVLFFAVYDLIKITSTLLFRNRKESVFMNLSYGGSLVPYEYVISVFTGILGFNRLLYLKGGKLLDCYRNGSVFHKQLFKKVLNLQQLIFFEGQESLKMAQNLTNKPLCYFPNYVFDTQIIKTIQPKSQNKIHLCYFGRIAPFKNVHIIINTFHLLCEKRNNVYLTIIGGAGQSMKYVEMIDEMIENSPYKDHVYRFGLSPFEFIIQQLNHQHFYLFPTQEPAEGHSNSLTECMSQGFIPIVSNFHFNRSVVNNDLLVVDGYEPEKYADRINYILNNYNIDDLANEVRQNVKDHFTYEVVFDRIKKELEIL